MARSVLVVLARELPPKAQQSVLPQVPQSYVLLQLASGRERLGVDFEATQTSDSLSTYVKHSECGSW